MRQFILIGSIAAIYLVLSLYILTNLNFYPFFGSKPLVLELLKTNFDLEVGIIFLTSIVNVFLIYLLTKNLFSPTPALIAATIYAISSWSLYLGIFNSLFVLAAFFELILGLGIILTKNIIKAFGWIVIGMLGLLNLSLLFWLPLLLFFGLNFKHHLLKKDVAKYSVLSLLFFQAGLLVLGLKDITNFKNIIKNDVTIFEDVGLINTVNVFQGETQKANLGLVGRLVENKYTYLPLNVAYNLGVNWIPQTFLTPKYKLLGFSNQPLLLIGLLIPLVLGLKFLQSKKKLLLTSGIFFLLTLPSVLASKSPDLNRLFIVSPLIFIIIGLGFEKLIKEQKKLLILCLILIGIQELVTLTDIYLREGLRLLPLVQHIYG